MSLLVTVDAIDWGKDRDHQFNLIIAVIIVLVVLPRFILGF